MPGRSIGPELVQAPRVQISLEDWQKMMAYVINCPTEINGFGFVEVRGDVIRVKDIFILDQVASPSLVKTDDTALNRFVYELAVTGEYDPGAIKFQWHSHVDMDSFFSPTDTANIERWSGNWLISLVVNKRGEYRCRLDLFSPLRVAVDVTPEIVATFDEDLLQSTADEIALKVRNEEAGFLGRRRVVASKPQASSSGAAYSPSDFRNQR